ncbi:GNAT family protein [Streptomyces sp. NPDC004667]|uniref:GNAT family N-acetyltransferase n=1 Tax=Streptomyces sp. NPDC004667 TaxID=3154285 RepID=UPI0033A0ADCD
MLTQDKLTAGRSDSPGPENIRMRMGPTALAPLNSSHAPLVTSWMNESAVYLNMGDIDSRPFTTEDGKRYVDSHLKDTWIILGEEPDGTWSPVGYSGIFVRGRHRVGIFRIAIGDRSARGKGHGGRATRLMLEWAFGELDLYSVHLSVSASNLHAISLYQNAGFHECGRYTESRREGGGRHDEILMEMHGGWYAGS